MDNASFADQIQQGCKALGVTVGEDVPPRLHRLMGELLKWNAKVNLTAITAEGEVVEKHFLDSLAVLPEVEGAGSVLDVGAGAGFPGLPLKMARPSLAVTMVDAVGKKVGYLKAVGEDELRAQAGKRNLKVVSARAYRLPFSGAERQVASFAKAE